VISSGSEQRKGSRQMIAISGPPSDSYPGYRTRSAQLGSEQDSTREGPYTPGKDRRRGQVRTLGEGLEAEDTGRSFGRGLASSGRPRNL
jgi:hypothetical protein